jgi:hypothetical protein
MNPDSFNNADAKPSDLSRRELFAKAGVAALGVAAGGLAASLPGTAAPAAPVNLARGKAEEFVTRLYDTLTADQKKVVALPWDHAKRTMVQNNWFIVDKKIGELYTPAQKEIITEILKGVTSEVGWDKIQRQMKDDAGGLDQYSCCLFGDPHSKQFEWVMAGRHLTLRADANSTPGVAFGGPIFYGHAVEDTEKPNHPGNVWWHQSRLANKVFAALDGKQQKLALLPKAPNDDPDVIKLKGTSGKFEGISVSELSHDQKGLIEQVTRALLEPYRKEDVDEAIKYVKANGGWDSMHLSFYEDDDIGNDKIWDRWKLEGPAFSWYFRGSPHVHTWVNVAAKA